MADRERPPPYADNAWFMRGDCVDVTALDRKYWYSMMHHELIVLSPHLKSGQQRLRMETSRLSEGGSTAELPGSGGLQAKRGTEGFGGIVQETR